MRALGRDLGVDLYVQRDDLLPFPLGGNKVRKVRAELGQITSDIDAIVTNGAIDSNHCRTVAMMGAERGLGVHLVLHGDTEATATSSSALRMLGLLGASYEIVRPADIRHATNSAKERLQSRGTKPHVIAGGCHTPAGAIAYRIAALEVFRQVKPNFVFVASGTGATQGGLAAAAQIIDPKMSVVGVSVARTTERGIQAVREAAEWAGAGSAVVNLDDNYRAGGYGLADSSVLEAIGLGWRYGLPLDPTYTGKAFSALVDYARKGALVDSRILFWHTGGLWNWLTANEK